MKYLKFISFVLLLSHFSGCKKFMHNYFKGIVTEEGSNEPIEGATVVLQYWNYPSKKGEYLYDTVYTNSQGKFVFYTKRHVGWAYRLWINDKNHSSYYADVTKEKPEYKVSLNPKGYLQLRIKKTSFILNTISVNYGNDNAFGRYFNANHSTPAYDTTLAAVYLVALRQQNISWNVTSYENGFYNSSTGVNSFSIPFYLTKNDTFKYTIEYN